MDRRTMVKNTCALCLGNILLPLTLGGCQSAHYVIGTLESQGISVQLSEFTYMEKEESLFREFIIVENEALQFPVYLSRFSDTQFSAVLMKCTHQGTELRAAGDHLYCPAHGSEFNNRGTVTQGPAEKDLRAFPVSVSGSLILIDLKA